MSSSRYLNSMTEFSEASTDARGGTFRSLQYRNARIFFLGLGVSNSGSWLQLTATSLLLYRLTGKAADIGYNVAFQYMPMLVLGLWAGTIADRVNRRKITLITQGLMATQALALGIFAVFDLINPIVIYSLSLILGMVNVFDNPARRGFVTELVPNAYIGNAVSLQVAVMTASRIVGATLASLLIGPLGFGPLFFLNGLSYLAILGSLLAIRKSEMFTVVRKQQSRSALTELYHFILRQPRLRTALVLYVVVAVCSMNFIVSLPKISDIRWGSDSYFGLLVAVIGAGSVVGSLMTARLDRVSHRWYALSMLTLGISSLFLAWAPSVLIAALVCIPLGVGYAAIISSVNSLTQQDTPNNMRSRMFSVTGIIFFGSTPIGGPITGLVADKVSPEWSIAYGGVACLLSAGVMFLQIKPWRAESV